MKQEKTKEEMYEDLKEQIGEKKEKLEEYVKKNPLKSLAGAIGLGTAIGFLAGLFKKKE